MTTERSQDGADSASPRCRTKIVATVGPACDGAAALKRLVQAGASVFRLNMAHGSPEQQEVRLRAIRQVSEELQTVIGVLIDLAGPKIRLGEIPGGEMTIGDDDVVRFVRGEQADRPHTLATTYEPLLDDLAPGDRVMLADGTVGLRVESVTADEAICRVLQSGLVRSRQGVNLPGVKLSTPSITEEDWRNVAWAVQAEIDFIGMSFVRSADDVRQLKQFIRGKNSPARVIAKIEKPEALDNLESILAAADGAMVARGDLGVEIDVARMAVVQKEIIAACNRLQRPVIVATQMLDSMQHNLHPTRAEATDVANAVLDGADACMLSGETAVGAHPRQAVEMMHRIALATEAMLDDRPAGDGGHEAVEGLHQITQALVHGADRIARRLKAQLIVAASHSGATALAVSNCRNPTPTVGFSDQASALRQMSLFWGIIPLWNAPPMKDAGELLRFVSDWGKRRGVLHAGDRIVLVRGTQLSAVVQNALVVHVI